MSKITSPLAGLITRFFVVLGAKKPLLSDFSSRIDEGSGVSVPIPTLFCALLHKATKEKAMVKIFFIVSFESPISIIPIVFFAIQVFFYLGKHFDG